MNVLIAGATGSVGLHVVNAVLAQGHQVRALVRTSSKAARLPDGVEKVYADVSLPETLTDVVKDVDAVIFTLGSDGHGRIGARAVDYGGVRNILRALQRPVRIVLMTTIGVTERQGEWNRRTEVHDWKRRAERLLRLSGHPYTIVRPGWFDYNRDDEHHLVFLQGDRRHSGTPKDGVIARRQIAEVMVAALSDDAAISKTFELVAEHGDAQRNMTPLFAALRADNPGQPDAIGDLNNMPFADEPECIQKELQALALRSGQHTF